MYSISPMMGELSASAKLEILSLLSVEDVYQLKGPEVDYLLYLTEGGTGGLELKQHSTADGYNFAVSSSLYPLLDVSDEDSHLRATSFGKLTQSPLKEGFLQHLLTLLGDVAFVDTATGWTLPVIIDHFLSDQCRHFVFSSLTITRSGCLRWPSADVSHRPCVTCSRNLLRKDGSRYTADETFHFDASYANRRLSICVTYRAEPVWDGRCWQYCVNRLDVLRLCLRFSVKSPCLSVIYPLERRATRIGHDVCRDAFGFLGRHDVDSCRLVCVAWNACCLVNSRSLPLHHVLQATEAKFKIPIQPGWAAPLRLTYPGLTVYRASDEQSTAGPVRLVEDVDRVVSYLDNSYVRLLKLDFGVDFTSNVLSAMENVSPSSITWNIGTVLLNFMDVNGLSDEFLTHVENELKPAHYRVQVSSTRSERVEHINAVFSRSLLRQRGFRLQLQWPGLYQNDALGAALRRSWMDFALLSGAPYISVVYVDSMHESEERPFSLDEIIKRLLEKDDIEGMAEEVELVALRPGLLTFSQQGGELIAEEIDEGHIVFTPVSHCSPPLNLRICWLGETPKLTLVVGTDGTSAVALRLLRGHVNAREVRVRATKRDRANNFMELRPY